MFITMEKLKRAVKEAFNEPDTKPALEKEIERLNKQLKELELKKELDIKEIEHLVKMKEEKQVVEAQKKEIELQKLFQKKEMDLQTQYHERVMKQIEEGRREIKEVYTEIMKRLPNVNMAIKQG